MRVSARQVPEFDLKTRRRHIDEHTKEVELFWMCMPVSREDLLETVRERADEIGDTKYKEWRMDHIVNALQIIFGGAQYKPGTNLWATKRYGCIQPPDFGRILSHDRFSRILRYWAKGPLDIDEEKATNPWAEVDWWITGFNERRKEEFIPGSRLTPDELMIAWTGPCGSGGIPHLSFVARKPDPLGSEFKCICDGSTGILLHIELQKGKRIMRRKKFGNDFNATTACTLRMLDAVGVKETNLDENKKPHRAVTADSWFASMNTAVALKEKLGVHFCGPIKTAHADFPAEALRWALVGKERGSHVVFKDKDRDLWAIGWSDHHYKLYLTTHGVTTPGEVAMKKRQRRDGRNYHIQIPRPSQVEDYAKEMGWVDRHNRFRQDIIGLSKVWRTKKWQTRLQLDFLSMAMVDAFLLAKKFHPKWAGNPGRKTKVSELWSFIETVLPQLGDNNLNESSLPSMKCVQVPIGKRKVEEGKLKGTLSTKQQRCVYCRKAGRKEKRKDGTFGTKTPRTSYTCIAHPQLWTCHSATGTCWAEHVQECKAMDDYADFAI